MKIKLITKGCTRIVILCGRYAFKFPNFLVQHDHFLKGCLANWSERKYTKTFKGFDEFISKVTPTLFCSWFGLISIQKRVVELDRDLTDSEKYYFKNQTEDIKKRNFGYLKGRLVCIDYAN